MFARTPDGGPLMATSIAPREIIVHSTQTGAGVAEGGKESRMSTRDGSLNPKMLIPCANPACKKGGFLLKPRIDKAVEAGKSSEEFEVPCAGYTGALHPEKGPAEKCTNKLSVKVEVKAAKAAKG